MNDRDEALKELGRLVNERREEAGMTLEDIYDRTRIRMEYLHGIEEGNYSNFPEPVYTKGFIRTYLKLINAEDLQPEFMKQLDRTNAPKKQIQHEAPQKSKQNILGNGSKIPEGYKPTSHFWLFMVLTLALIGTGSYVWYAFAYGNLDVSKVFNFANRTGLNFTGSENENKEREAEPKPEKITEPVKVAQVSQDKKPAEPKPEPPKIKPTLEIVAVNDVWLQVNFGTAQPVFKRTLKKDNNLKWDLTAPARVIIGRPSAARVILNGKDLGIVNPKAKKGEVYIYNPDGTFNRANAQ